VTKGMELALQKTWEAVPEPRIAIALGACAISGGPSSATPSTTAVRTRSSPSISTSPAAPRIP
jgi:Ni,Fe-hydrogenase III small subunit